MYLASPCRTVTVTPQSTTPASANPAGSTTPSEEAEIDAMRRQFAETCAVPYSLSSWDGE